MGNQVSSVRVAATKLALDSRKKGTRLEKTKIGILAFEVANVMSKAIQLWQSLADQEILRLCKEVIKSEGVLNLVSDNESVLLTLACLEKLQDLTTVAVAVARLGRRCHEPALQGFEHVYNDILKQNIDVVELEYSHKQMEAKVRKMERYMAGTSNLYQELEILSEMEQALRRAHDEDDAGQKDNFYILEQKVVWQRQEIKYLKDISLWNRTYDKIVSLLARTVCTIYGRIINVFGFPMTGWPQILMNCEVSQSHQSENSRPFDSGNRPSGSHCAHRKVIQARQTDTSSSVMTSSSGPLSSPGGRGSNASLLNGFSTVSQNAIQENYRAFSICFSPGRQFSQEKNMSASLESTVVGSHRSQAQTHGSSSGPLSHKDQKWTGIAKSGLISGNIAVSGSVSGAIMQHLPFSGICQNGGTNKLLFDPKSRLQDAPPSTLGGTALALHYANVIIIVEKMVRYPHLISQDSRDDLYQMLPKNVRMGLRARLRPCMRSITKYGDTLTAAATDWKEELERILGWLAPLAHNMIQWQSEHNFEQQHVVSRTSVLLIQTLYFADQLKAEAAITELLVGLNYLWRHERELKANGWMEYASNKDLDDYLEWQM